MSKPEWISNLSQDKELQEKRENLILKNIENNKIQFSNLKKTIKRISKEVAGAIGKKEDSLRIVESENEIFIGYDYGVMGGLDDNGNLERHQEGFVFINNGSKNSFILAIKGHRGGGRPLQSVAITDITEKKIYEIFHILVKHRMYDSSMFFYRFYAIIQISGEWFENIGFLFFVMLWSFLMYLAVFGAS